jgi:hypothetical protein
VFNGGHVGHSALKPIAVVFVVFVQCLMWLRAPIASGCGIQEMFDFQILVAPHNKKSSLFIFVSGLE